MSSVGCDGAATALCFNKPDTKEVLSDAGLQVARGVTVTAQEFAADPGAAMDRVQRELGGGAWFVKPAGSGSSVGIARVDYRHQFDQAVHGALRWDNVALVEEYVPHREFVVGVLGNDRLVLSPPGECIPVGHLYTYEEKYRLGNPRFTCPAWPPVMEQRRAAEAASKTGSSRPGKCWAMGERLKAAIPRWRQRKRAELLERANITRANVRDYRTFTGHEPGPPGGAFWASAARPIRGR